MEGARRGPGRGGLGTKDALLQTPDGWGSFYEFDLAAEGRPLAEIEQSPLAAEAAESREGRDVRPYDADLTFPDPEPAFATALRDAVILRLDFEEVSDSFGVLSPAPRIDPLVLAETLGPLRPRRGERPRIRAARPAVRAPGHDGSADRADRLRRKPEPRRCSARPSIPDRDRLGRAIALLRQAVPRCRTRTSGTAACSPGWSGHRREHGGRSARRHARRADPHLRIGGLLDELFRTLSPSWL